MSYITFYHDQERYDIDLDIMDRIKELQDAVISLQEKLGDDTSVISASVQKAELHAAELEERIASDAKIEQALLSAGLLSAEEGT